MFGWLKFKKSIKPDTTNVEFLPYADLPVDRVLDDAREAKLNQVTLVGWREDGSLYMKSSYSKRSASYWDLALMQRELMDR